MAVLLIFSLLAFYSNHLWGDSQKNYGRKIAAYIFFTGLVECAILLYSSGTMFLAEFANSMQNMLLAFQRYAAPFTVGSYMLVLAIFLEFSPVLAQKFSRKISSRVWSVRATCLVMCLGIFSCSLTRQYQLFVGYRQTGVGLEAGDGILTHGPLSETEGLALQTVQELMKEDEIADSRIAFAALPGATDLGLAWIPYFCAPVSTANVGIYEGYTTSDIISIMQYSKCNILCILSGQTIPQSFSTADGKNYLCNTFYKIVETETGCSLVELKELSPKGVL